LLDDNDDSWGDTGVVGSGLADISLT